MSEYERLIAKHVMTPQGVRDHAMKEDWKENFRDLISDPHGFLYTFRDIIKNDLSVSEAIKIIDTCAIWMEGQDIESIHTSIVDYFRDPSSEAGLKSLFALLESLDYSKDEIFLWLQNNYSTVIEFDAFQTLEEVYGSKD